MFSSRGGKPSSDSESDPSSVLRCGLSATFTGDFETLDALDSQEFCTLIISVPFSHLEYAFSRSLLSDKNE
uniref:Uncharacterized protein n=1 Tax=Aegilops tauschii subsp. strangulata TaxID=200361 RepID=A0A453IRJ6_AEGTS